MLMEGSQEVKRDPELPSSSEVQRLLTHLADAISHLDTTIQHTIERTSTVAAMDRDFPEPAESDTATGRMPETQVGHRLWESLCRIENLDAHLNHHNMRLEV